MANTQYDILSIETQPGVNDAGRLVEQVVVRYRTQYGDSGTVKLDKSMYTASAVKELILNEIKENDDLRGMK